MEVLLLQSVPTLMAMLEAKTSQSWLENTKTSWSSRSLPTLEVHLGNSHPNPFPYAVVVT